MTMFVSLVLQAKTPTPAPRDTGITTENPPNPTQPQRITRLDPHVTPQRTRELMTPAAVPPQDNYAPVWDNVFDTPQPLQEESIEQQPSSIDYTSGKEIFKIARIPVVIFNDIFRLDWRWKYLFCLPYVIIYEYLCTVQYQYYPRHSIHSLPPLFPPLPFFSGT